MQLCSKATKTLATTHFSGENLVTTPRNAARELVAADVQLGQLLQGGQLLRHLALQVVAGDGQLQEVGEGRQLTRVGLAEDALDLVVAEVQAAGRVTAWGYTGP